MNFTVKTGDAAKERVPCMVVGLFEPHRFSAAAKQIDQASGGYLSKLVKTGDINGKEGATRLLHAVPNIAAERVLLVGCGTEKAFAERSYVSAYAAAVGALDAAGVREAGIFLADLPVKERSLEWRMKVGALAARDAAYRFEKPKGKTPTTPCTLKHLSFYTSERRPSEQLKQGLKTAAAMASGMDLARTLGNLPSNVCTPSYLASQARVLARKHKNITAKALTVGEMEKLGMGALLAVAKGSREPARLIILHYAGAAKTKAPVVLVGKGVTFDSGGISIKPAAAMDEMKFDMCGAASVLGTLLAVAELGLPINVVGVIPATENLPDGNATKPGDVVTSLSGQTIEILNTDAEGRLILCDALTYSERYKPAVVIDIATLTGACVIALGNHATGLLSNDGALARDLLAAGEASWDRAWELPLWDDYQEQLKTNFADMANVGGRPAGTITAACFLARFTEKFRWAHLDIAGTAWRTGDKKSGTGRPVALLTQYLVDYSR